VLGPLCERERDRPGAPSSEPVRILEVASGSGEHAAYFAAALPFVVWQPSDRDIAALTSIDAYRLELGVKNVLPPLRVDARAEVRLPTRQVFDGLVCINMIHISPWSSTLGLFASTRELVREGGFVLLYGPYRRGGRHTAESNARFDADLRVRNPEWGVRDLDEVVAVAHGAGFTLERVVEMPRDNLTVVLRKAAARGGDGP
jgi:SAM-dependent methyltransferase